MEIKRCSKTGTPNHRRNVGEESSQERIDSAVGGCSDRVSQWIELKRRIVGGKGFGMDEKELVTLKGLWGRRGEGSAYLYARVEEGVRKGPGYPWAQPRSYSFGLSTSPLNAVMIPIGENGDQSVDHKSSL